jgi:F0F1-type ATP synthase membrane subunit c/vacuolar-type H+-ATPase subunit K
LVQRLQQNCWCSKCSINKLKIGRCKALGGLLLLLLLLMMMLLCCCSAAVCSSFLSSAAADAAARTPADMFGLCL